MSKNPSLFKYYDAKIVKKSIISFVIKKKIIIFADNIHERRIIALKTK